jgi:exosortase
LVWKKKDVFKDLDKVPSLVGLVILVASLLFYILGLAGGIEVIPRLTIVSTLSGIVIYNLGTRVFLAVAFPLLFLCFMVPIPTSVVGLISLPLQLIATKLSAFLINSFGIPVFREGNILHFANTSLEVAEACSGIRSLTAFLMLGTLFAYFAQSGARSRVLLIVTTVPFAFSANLLRVTATGVLAHFFGGRVARGFLHEFSGIMVFVLGFVAFSALLCLMERTRRGKT